MLLELLLNNTGLARAGICGHPMTERERQGVHTWATLEEACSGGLTSSSFWLRSSTSHCAADFAAADAPRPACRSGTDTTRSAWQVTCAWAKAERQCTPHEASVKMIQMPGKAFDDASWSGGVRGDIDNISFDRNASRGRGRMCHLDGERPGAALQLLPMLRAGCQRRGHLLQRRLEDRHLRQSRRRPQHHAQLGAPQRQLGTHGPVCRPDIKGVGGVLMRTDAFQEEWQAA